MKKRNRNPIVPLPMKSLRQFDFTVFRDRLSGNGDLTDEFLVESIEQLEQLSTAAQEGSPVVLSQGAEMLAQLLKLAQAARGDGNGNGELFGALVAFAVEHVSQLETPPHEPWNDQRQMAIAGFIEQARNQWSEYLVCLDSVNCIVGSDSDDWTGATGFSDLESGDSEPADDSESFSDPVHQIDLLLAALGEESCVPVATDSEPGPTRAPQRDPAGEVQKEDAETLFEDDEMRAAFLDDATRCLDSMEKSSLSVEQNPNDTDAIQQFCRELHTLKGASASVGLADLATFIHKVESTLEGTSGEATEPSVETMLNAVDRVRSVVARFSSPVNKGGSVPAAASAEIGGQSASLTLANHSIGDESLIRIRATKLDRLMDMLAELVVLRNRRESHIAEFIEFNEELSRCSSRLSFCQDSHGFLAASQPGNFSHANVISGSNTLSEIARDISVVSTSIRDLQKPVSMDNLAISHFIRDFRQELMQLRRVPIAGLFHRLQRAARDAAKKEGKTLQLVYVGEESGLEQELQEKLYEPLLHIIRNAVSHGIETEAERKKAGKNRVGRIVLEAQSNSQLLALEIRDDGGGLDYDAIRRRAVEKGLMAANQQLSQQELGRMIFHPGFSTCQQATEVSGRGVGMDIVANVLEQIRGRIEIDSVRGQGTTMRLTIPLRSAIEHVMVFRTSDQLFALPMQFVSAARKSGDRREDIPTTALAALLSLPKKADLTGQAVLILISHRQLDGSRLTSEKPAADRQRIGMSVDEIIGPEEVVVRNLPAPLNSHPLFCGLTLSGAGESVLLLDGRKLVEFFEQYNSATHRQQNAEPIRNALQKKQVLVVDDSLSARKSLVKKLQQLGFNTVEAGDGIEALDLLRQKQFELVITDLDMPRLGGLELLSDLRQRRRGQFLQSPVIVVSSRNEADFRQRCIDGGAVDYLIKPVNDDSLQRVLSELELNTNNSKTEEREHE